MGFRAHGAAFITHQSLAAWFSQSRYDIFEALLTSARKCKQRGGNHSATYASMTIRTLAKTTQPSSVVFIKAVIVRYLPVLSPIQIIRAPTIIVFGQKKGTSCIASFTIIWATTTCLGAKNLFCQLPGQPHWTGATLACYEYFTAMPLQWIRRCRPGLSCLSLECGCCVCRRSLSRVFWQTFRSLVLLLVFQRNPVPRVLVL